MEKEKVVEYILLALFSLSILYFASIFDNGQLIHSVPTNLNAGDMYIFSGFADVARYSNDMKVVPPYLAGGAHDALNFFSPLSGIIMAQLSSGLNAENYDFDVHINLFSLIAAVFIMYFLLKTINRYAALVSLPLFLLLFKWPFNFVIQWGGLIGNVNLFFVVITLYCFYYLELPFMPFVLGIVQAASFFSHGREFQTLNIAFAIYFIFWIIKEKAYKKILENPKGFMRLFQEEPSFKALLRYIVSVIVTTIFIFPWWSAFSAIKEANSGGPLLGWGYNPLFHQVKFSDFGVFLYLIIFGIITGLVYLYKKDNRKINMLSIFSFMFFIASIIIIAGNGMPQGRAFYVITLLPLLCIFFINFLSMIEKGVNASKEAVTITIFALLLLIAFVGHQPESIGSGSLIHPLRMDSFNWIKDNVEDNATILAVYGDEYNQKSIFSLARRPYQVVDQDDYFAKIKEGLLTSKYNISKWVVHFKFTRDTAGKIISDKTVLAPSEGSLCDYKYVYTDKYSQSDVLKQYGALLVATLVKESKFEIVYENQLVVILKNNNVGGTCFTDKTLTKNG